MRLRLPFRFDEVLLVGNAEVPAWVDREVAAAAKRLPLVCCNSYVELVTPTVLVAADWNWIQKQPPLPHVAWKVTVLPREFGANYVRDLVADAWTLLPYDELAQSEFSSGVLAARVARASGAKRFTIAGFDPDAGHRFSGRVGYGQGVGVGKRLEWFRALERALEGCDVEWIR